MKRTILFYALLFLASTVLAQSTTEFEALNLAQREIRGTARYMGLAGAFGALGGDPSAIKINPAGLGIYRRQEFSLSSSILTQEARGQWLGTRADDNLVKAGIDNFSFVWVVPKRRSDGLISSNWGFSYNKSKNFNRYASVKSAVVLGGSITDQIALLTNQSNIPETYFSNNSLQTQFNDADGPAYLSTLAYEKNLIKYEDGGYRSVLGEGENISFDYFLSEKGSVNDMAISWAGNINNKFYMGAEFNFSSVDYAKEIEYSERSNEGFDLRLSSGLSTVGGGMNLNLGFIYRPIDPLRIGIAYQTPTWYNLRDEAYNLSLNGIRAESARYDYQLRTQGRLTTSIAYVFGKRAILSADLVYSSFSDVRLLGDDGRRQRYIEENNVLKKSKPVFTFKTGLEFSLINNLFARAGFAIENTAMRPGAKKFMPHNSVRGDFDSFALTGMNYATLGLGYRTNYWAFDFALVRKGFKESFVPFNSLDITNGTIKTQNYNFIGTVALRF